MINFDEFIKLMNIKYIYISESLKWIKKRILNKYNLIYDKNKIDINEPAIFFGIYKPIDRINIKKHKGKKILMPGGNDTEDLINIKNIHDIFIISISKSIETRLINLNINSLLINFNPIDKNIFKPFDITGKNLYIYNGHKKNHSKKYKPEIIQKILKKYTFLNYILSVDLKKEYNEMPEVYKKCFLGLRLTDNDGNANTVQEFKEMNLPIVHNQSEYGLKWNNETDIINYIEEYAKKYNVRFNEFYLNIKNDNRTKKIYFKDLRKFFKNIENYKHYYIYIDSLDKEILDSVNLYLIGKVLKYHNIETNIFDFF